MPATQPGLYTTLMDRCLMIRGAEDDPWGLSQGLAGSQAIICRRGFANRPNYSEEMPVTVVIMPKVRRAC